MPRGVYKRKPRVEQQAQPKAKEHSVSMTVNVEHTPYVLTVRNNGRVVGTVEIKRDGMTFHRPNKKKRGGKCMGYDMLSKLQELGL